MTVEQTRPDQRYPEGSPPAGVRTMAVVRWVLVAVMAVIATGAVLSHFVPFGGSSSALKAGAKLYYCPMHPQIVQDHPGECPICSMTLVPKPKGPVKASATMTPAAGPNEKAKLAAAGPGKYWCPMHPHVTSDDPDAKCDLCGGMKLVPKPTGARTAVGAAKTEPVPGLVAVDIPADRVQKIGIRTARVARESLVNDLRTAGVVEANERGLAQISPRFSGWIEQLFVAETGQKVRRGQALATIYSPEVLQAQQELLTALGWSTTPGSSPSSALPHHRDNAPLEGLLGDARRRLELLGISDQEIDALVKRRQPQRAIAIRSPVEGHVIGKNAVAGMSVAAGTTLFAVADLSTVWVVAEVYESDVQRVRVGQPARFETSAYPGESFNGKVQFIYPTLDATSRTLRLRLEIKNRPGAGALKLRPGMFGSVMLDLPATTGLMVPAEAVVDTGDFQYLFVASEGGRFEPRRVKLGARLGESFEVLEGVAAGEAVVTTANFLVDSESRLHAAIEGQVPKSDEPESGSGVQKSSVCGKDIDAQKYPQKYKACLACEAQHRGMGTMEEDCKKTIAKPWR
jgi:Cu(I)/Ag(I) efflux system membrane fusion protein